MNKIASYCRYLLLIGSTLVLFCACQQKKSWTGGVKKPRLNPKYNSVDKEPMGSYIAYHYLNSLFDNGVTDITNKSFSNLRYDINYSKSLYIIVSKGVFMSGEDIESIMSYVSNGNIAFISADYITNELLDTLGVKASFDINWFFYRDEYQMEKDDTWVSLKDDQNKYGFYFVPFHNRIVDYDTSVTQILGKNQYGQPNFIAVDHGQGKFIFHTAPAVFSNYFLLTKDNKEYLEKAFSYFDPGTSSVYWDDYYRARRSGKSRFSIIGFFRKHPPLFFGLLVALGGLLLFIAFGGKRRQRFVPEKVPNTNTTVSYTETIGRLYLQKKDNRNIALKMFTYFLEYVRNHYYLNTQNLNNEFAEALSRKSGVAEVKVRRLLSLMDDIDRSDNVSDIRLLDLHNHLQEYFKK